MATSFKDQYLLAFGPPASEYDSATVFRKIAAGLLQSASQNYVCFLEPFGERRTDQLPDVAEDRPGRLCTLYAELP